MATVSEPLVTIRDLHVTFTGGARPVRAVNGVDLTVARGDTVASLARRMAYPSAQEERFLVLNALRAGEALVPGQKVKIVVRAR